METWSWSRRSGKLAIDPFTLGKLLLNVCGNLAHVFLVVIFFTSLYWFAFFKQQNFLHVLLPSEKQVTAVLNESWTKLLQMGHFRPLFINFVFQTTVLLYNKVIQNNTSSIQCRKSNSQPFERQPPPITTRPVKSSLSVNNHLFLELIGYCSDV